MSDVHINRFGLRDNSRCLITIGPKTAAEHHRSCNYLCCDGAVTMEVDAVTQHEHLDLQNSWSLIKTFKNSSLKKTGINSYHPKPIRMFLKVFLYHWIQSTQQRIRGEMFPAKIWVGLGYRGWGITECLNHDQSVLSIKLNYLLNYHKKNAQKNTI